MFEALSMGPALQNLRRADADCAISIEYNSELLNHMSYSIKQNLIGFSISLIFGVISPSQESWTSHLLISD